MKKSIKLVHVISSLETGGAQAVLFDLCVHLPQDQFQHHVIFFHHGPYVERLRNLGVDTYHVHGLLFLYDPLFFMRLFLLIKKLKPDVLHTLLWVANFAGRIIAYILRIPCVSVLHNNVDQDGKLRNVLDAFTLQFFDKLVAVSDQVALSLQKVHPALPIKPVEIISNGIDIDAIQSEAKKNSINRSELGLHQGHYVIGSVGRLHQVKNFDFLLEFFVVLYKKYDYVRLVLVGSGPEEIRLRKKAQELGIGDFVAFIIDKQAHGYYPLFDCFVQSSQKEGVSLALLEAMSFSLPCVVRSAEKCHSVITHNVTGFVVDRSTHYDFVHAVELLINDKFIGNAIGRQGCQAVINYFSYATMIKKYTNVFTCLQIHQ